MTEKGLVERDERDRTHIYRARLSEETTQRQLVRDLLDRAFGGSSSKLVMQALATKRASAEELRDIRKAIDGARNEREVRMMTMPAIETLLQQPAAQAVGWALLQFVWQGAAVGVAHGARARGAAPQRRPTSATSSRAIGLALMLTLPVVTGVQKFQSLRADADAAAAAAPRSRPTAVRHRRRGSRAATSPVARAVGGAGGESWTAGVARARDARSSASSRCCRR